MQTLVGGRRLLGCKKGSPLGKVWEPLAYVVNGEPTIFKRVV